MATQILLCSVGGSHQPIITAIQALKDKTVASGDEYFICFFCTGKDGSRPGSIEHITGQGNVIKANFSDTRATLKNIPTQTSLPESSYDTCIVPPDNLDEAYLLIRRKIRTLSDAHPEARFVADYTGGTKTMTAALVCAALESHDIAPQLVVGIRVDLISASDGTQAAAGVDISRMRVDREVTRHLRVWEQFSYHQAARTLSQVPSNAGTPDHRRIQLARVLSKGLALWDDFDHKGAFELLDRCRGDVCRSDGSMVGMFSGDRAARWRRWRQARSRPALRISGSTPNDVLSRGGSTTRLRAGIA